MIRTVAFTVLAGLTLAACGPQRPAIDPSLNSGVTSSNGGGVRATGGINQLEIGPNGARPTPSNTTGRAY